MKSISGMLVLSRNGNTGRRHGRLECNVRRDWWCCIVFDRLKYAVSLVRNVEYLMCCYGTRAR